LIGEVIRRITGQRLGEFFRAEIAGPLGADFYIGVPPSEFHRIANVVPPPEPPTDLTQLDPKSVVYKTITGPENTAENSWTDRWRRADIGGANGHGNARSVAHIQSAVACGGMVDGVRLLSPKTIDRVFEVHASGIDLVMGVEVRMGLGYGLLPLPQVLPFLPHGRIGAWGGLGGSIALVDADRRMTFAYVMNKLEPGMVGATSSELVERVYDIVNR
jgi:CubicO group peptidase (beta-lactamase class C family)